MCKEQVARPGKISWMVWICTTLSILLLFISSSVKPEVSLSKFMVHDVSCSLLNNRLIFTHTKIVGPPPKPVVKPAGGMSFCGPPTFYTRVSAASILSPPRIRTVRSLQPTGLEQIKTIDLPLLFVSIPLVLWSVWLLWRVRDAYSRDGYCKGCGYSLDGLKGDVCPECGEKCGVNDG